MNFIAKHIPAIGLLMLTGFVATAAALYWDVPVRLAEPPGAQAVADYSCPMHPAVVSHRPGACSKCGMALKPPTAAAGEPAGCNHSTPAVLGDAPASASGCAPAGGGCCSPKANAAPLSPAPGGCTRALVNPTENSTP